MTEEVREQAVSLGQDARQQLHTQARAQTEHLGETLHSVADHLHALADGRPEEAGQARDLLDRIAEQVTEASRRIDELGFDGAVDELQRFARRRPGVFLASAAAIGFAGSRLTQGAKADRDNQDRSSSSGEGSGYDNRVGRSERSTGQSSGQLPSDRPPAPPSGPSPVPAAATPGHISGPAARGDGR